MADHDKLEAALYIVATPIGAARDITLRALDILAAADVIAAEDTRTARHLMEIHGIAVAGRPMVAYHDHNGPRARPGLLRHIEEGRSVAYVSEAGTPLVADPGFALARAVIAAGGAVRTAPGASALLAALCVSGLPTDRFSFHGFLPTAKGARARFLAEAADMPGTQVFYESPRRVSAALDEMVAAFGADRDAALCRELTKRFEEVRRGTLGDLAEQAAGRSHKGEIVLVIGPAPMREIDDAMIVAAIRTGLRTGSVSETVAKVAADLGVARRRVYALALKAEDRE